MASFKGILNFIATNIQFGFNVANREAIKYFESKGLKPVFSYDDLASDEYRNALIVAKMTDMDMLQDVHDSLTHALKKGWTYDQWSDRIIPILQANGWWGRQEVIDPATGKTVIAQLGSPHRLKTIFRTNMQQAYQVGRWQQIMETAKERPYLRYDAIDDSRTRPMHRKWNGTILPFNHPWWRKHYPPNGFNCRCSVTQFSKADLEAKGYKVTEKPDLSTDGIDAGFDYNPGLDHWNHLQDIASQKASKIKDKALREAAQEALLKSLDELPKVVKLPDGQYVKSSHVDQTLIDQQNIIAVVGQKHFDEYLQKMKSSKKAMEKQLEFGLSDAEMASICAYTDIYSEDLNKILRGGTDKFDQEKIDKNLKFADILSNALNKLPSITAVVRRDVNLPDEIAKDFIEDNILIFDGFSSSANTLRKVMDGKYSYSLTIKSIDGKSVEFFSMYGKKESEVLFDRQSVFMVERVGRKKSGVTPIQLIELKKPKKE